MIVCIKIIDEYQKKFRKNSFFDEEVDDGQDFEFNQDLKLKKEQEALDGYDIKRELNEQRSNRIKKKI